MAKHSGSRVWTQLRSMFKVGMIGFGGGSALIPVLERELVSHGNALSEPVFIQDTVIANITPGALPVKIGALSGLQLGGPWLAFGSALAVALPGAAGAVAILALFSFLGEGAVRAIEYASLGIAAFILFLLGAYIMKVIENGGNRRRQYVVIALLSFALTGSDRTRDLIALMVNLDSVPKLPQMSALGLIVVALLAIAVHSLVQLRSASLAHPPRPRTRPPSGIRTAIGVPLAAAALAALAVWLYDQGDRSGEFMALVATSTLSSFGGGEAYVGVADGFFVTSGFVTPEVFYGQIVPVANALPGPILVKIAAGIGYAHGTALGGTWLGIAQASAAFLITIGASSAVALGVLAGYERASHSVFIQNIGHYILPVICGLLISTSISMLISNAEIGMKARLPATIVIAASLALAAAIWWLHHHWRVPDAILLGGAGALSLITLLAA